MPDPTLKSDDPVNSDELARSRRRVARHARSVRRRRSRRIVYGIALLAAVAGALADGEPTGLFAADVVYRGMFAALLTIGAAHAKRWAWFIVAGVAGAVGSDDPLPFALAGASLATSFGSLWYGRRQREFGAIAGALAAQSLLRLPTELAFAVPTLAATAASVPVVISGIRNSTGFRRWRWPALLAVVALGTTGAGFVVAMIDAESNAREGLVAARAGLEAAGQGDDPASAAEFARAGKALDQAQAAVTRWWATPARFVPVLAQHITAVDDIAREGRSLAALSAEQAATLDVTGLSRDEGGFDLDRIATLTPTATIVVEALERAQRVVHDADSPWLVPPAADRIGEFVDEIDRVVPTARNARDGLAIAPELLGADGPRTYLVLVGNPAESRELGGFVASVGYISAERGDLDFTSAGSVTSANRAVAESGLMLEGDLPAPLPSGSPQRFVQNWANTVDFAAVSTIAEQLGPGIADAPIDGVLYLDPYAIADLLRITGPVPIEGRGPLRAEDAVDFLLRDQYLSPDFESDGERKDRLRDAADAAFDVLTSSSLPDPRRMADLLSPGVHARRLLFSTGDEGPHDLLERVGLRPPLDLGESDQLLLAQENLRANKLDAYLERSWHYDLTVDDAGNAEGTVTVDLTNTAPTEGLDPYVTGDGARERSDTLPETVNRISLDLYSRLDVTSVEIDGEPVGSSTTQRDGLFRSSARVNVPASSTVTVTFRLQGEIPPDVYRLSVIPNGTAGTDDFSADLDVAGWTAAVRKAPLTQTLTVRADQ